MCVLTSKREGTLLCLFAALVAFAFAPTSSAFARQTEGEPAVAKPKEDETIEDRQKRILNSYSELEQKLLALREYEKGNNPARSKLLRRAYELSQEQGTALDMKQILSLSLIHI